MKNIDIDMASLENIDIDKDILENIDINKAILENIDIDKISYRLGFGIYRTPLGHTVEGCGRQVGSRAGRRE